MRFVLVNGRTPCPQSFCALCCKPIGASYLREIETRISYCDDNCYAEHCEGAVLAIDNRAKASLNSPRHIERQSDRPPPLRTASRASRPNGPQLKMNFVF